MRVKVTRPLPATVWSSAHWKWTVANCQMGREGHASCPPLPSATTLAERHTGNRAGMNNAGEPWEGWAGVPGAAGAHTGVTLSSTATRTVREQSRPLTPGHFLRRVWTVLSQKDSSEANKIQDKNLLPGTSLPRAPAAFCPQPCAPRPVRPLPCEGTACGR